MSGERIDTDPIDLTAVEDRALTHVEFLTLYAEFETLNEAYIMGCLHGLGIDNDRRHRYNVVRAKLHDEVELAVLDKGEPTDGE